MTSTPLANLAKVRKLDTVPVSKELGRRLLETARVRLKDASITQISNEGRFESAYAAIRYAADIGLLLHGYRTSTSSPGHHQTAIGCLVHTLDVDARTISLLDSLRKQRNLADYEGDPVTAGALNECIRQASALVAQLEDRLRREGWL